MPRKLDVLRDYFLGKTSTQAKTSAKGSLNIESISLEEPRTSEPKDYYLCKTTILKEPPSDNPLKIMRTPSAGSRNIEVLRNYYLGKDPMLKETLADNSLRLIGIPGSEFVVRREIVDFKRYIDEGDRELEEAIEDEAIARQNADEELRIEIGTVEGEIPTKVSELENDSGYLTEEVDPSVDQMSNADIIRIFNFNLNI